MAELAEIFLNESRRYLLTDYLGSIEQAVSPLSDDQIWWRPNEESNSIGNLILHLCGNARQWIVGGVGKLPNERHRQQEFDERQLISREQLLTRLRTVVAEADATLAKLSEADLNEPRHIQGRDTTVLKAIFHVVEHFSTHTGQIAWIAKSRPGTFDR